MKILITGGSGFIGTNLIEYLSQNYEFLLNIDIKSPQNHDHNPYWHECDIKNYDEMKKIFFEFSPEVVIHLAARADVDGKTLDDYKDNTEGTRVLLDVIKLTKSVKHVIITSTQFVNQYHGLPKHDEDYAPHTVYGESKVITEQLTRKAELECAWTIIRPTNIWGPWHNRYPHEFWRIIAGGKYFHPRGKPVYRSYGFIGNVIWQILRILELPAETINRKTLYAGDEPIELFEWTNGFSLAQTGRSVKQLPTVFLRGIAYFGELLKIFDIKFPITLSRLESMTTSNPAPMRSTFELLGDPPYKLTDGINITVEWMKIYHPELIKI